jgi:NifU-like protein
LKTFCRYPAGANAVPSRVAAEIAIADEQGSTATVTVPKLTTIQKIRLIQQVLDTEIRPMLIADGGDVQLHDVEGDRVLVKLKGACGSCASSTAILKYSIEAKLQDLVLPTLTVEEEGVWV